MNHDHDYGHSHDKCPQSACSPAAATVTLGRKMKRIYETTPFSLMVNGNRMLGRAHTAHHSSRGREQRQRRREGIGARANRKCARALIYETEKERKLIKVFKITLSEADRCSAVRFLPFQSIIAAQVDFNLQMLRFCHPLWPATLFSSGSQPVIFAYG